MTKNKSPKQLRQAIEAAKLRIDLVRRVLDANTQERDWGLGVECFKTSAALKELVERFDVPAEYKVAVVGRFKAGKSSFVNELLGRSLAGENTNPETAAVTTFCHGNSVKAAIQFVAQAEWDELKQVYKEEPKSPDAHRVANWFKFNKKKPDPDDTDGEIYDEAALAALEKQYLAAGGRPKEIVLDESLGKKGESAFRRELKRFTTSTKPHHCLVQTIDISTPSDLLDEGVRLIDTPGLDDTERFRVSLTEEAVEGVDAILFLTQSGVAYGQSEKDFLLTLLRKGTVKQLVFVITQVDKTYAQHVRQARDEGEHPQPIEKRVEIERRRIEQQVEATLLELGDGSDSPALQRYQEQLGDVEVIFTSAASHRDWLAKEEVKHPLQAGDPGGMMAVKRALLDLLSTESRLAATARAIEAGAGSLLDTMVGIIQNRRAAVHNIKNREEAERKLGLFRSQLEQAGSEFSATTSKDMQTLTSSLSAKARLIESLVENILLQAEAVLSEYETSDAARHWKTRRSGNWGFMSALQAKVANAIFPKVAGLLSEQQEEFLTFIDKFKAHLDYLSATSHSVSESLELGSEVRLDVSERLAKFLQEILVDLQSLVTAEEQRIVTLLDEFVTQDVQDRIAAARESVADEWGAGTTYRQTLGVRKFYSELKQILRDALRDHVQQARHGFAEYLQAQASLLPDKAIGEIGAELERMQANITAAAEAAMQGKKAAFDELAERLSKPLSETAAWLHESLAIDGPNEVPDGCRILQVHAKAPAESSPQHPLGSVTALSTEAKDHSAPLDPPETGVFDKIRRDASDLRERYVLKRGAGNWALPRIFADRYLKDATHALIVDPYLSRPQQMRNLGEFIACLRRIPTFRTLRVITGTMRNEDVAEHDASLRELALQLEQVGVNLVWDRVDSVHDRFVVLDTGVVFKLGRGLDIYKHASGLARTTPELRQVHECEIDVFSRTAVK